jgi:carboxylate-amine ligase
MTHGGTWSRWNPVAARRPWTVGIEEEVVIMDASGLGVANRVADLLDALPPIVAQRATAEAHACVVELETAPAETVGEACAALEATRAGVDRVARGSLGLTLAAAGTHPLAVRSEVTTPDVARYEQIASTMRALARREPTMALHVHVAVPDGDAAVMALDGLRADLPLLLALSANSPYWRGADSGFASIRIPIFSMFPRVGIARRFGSYSAYVRLVEGLVRAGAIADHSFLWWDARLQPGLGTVEVRIMDAQSRVADVAALAALVQCLVHDHATLSARGRPPVAEFVAENRFLAARDGLEAVLVDATGPPRPAADAVADLIDRCAPTAAVLGCRAELQAAHDLAGDPPHERQRRSAERHGLAAVPSALADAFVSSTPIPAAARGAA